MTAPVYNSIPIGGYIPLLKRTISTQSTNLLLHDFYPEIFKRMGILRDEMLAITKAYTTTDPLVGTAVLRYIGEDTSIKDDTKIKPLQ
jgi:hypothetical protein